MANSSPALLLLLALASPRLASAGNVPGIAGSEGSGRGFQGQYTHQYAAQFEEYMSSGDQGKGGNLPRFASGVLGEHASGFQKYMDMPGFNATAGESATSGDFQQYMGVNFMGQAGAANATAPTTEASSMQAGGYQQYYQKYMHQGGAQQSQTGGYQQYVGDYQKYMRQGGAQQSQSGGYQQYMRQAGAANATAPSIGGYQQYMDYQKYMHQGGAQQSQSGGYQQYMDNYVNFIGQAGAANATAPSSGGYQQYMDYQKYMHQGGAQQSQSGGYQQYMDKYAADYLNFMGQAGAANATAPSSGGYQQYMDYQKYMHQGGAQQSQSGGYQQYMDKYAADYVNFMGQAGAANATAPTTEASSMQAGGYQQYVDKYARDYQKYMHQGGAQQPQSGDYHRYMDGYAPNLTNASDPKEWAAYYAKRYAGEYQKYIKENISNYSVSFAGSNMTQNEALQQWGKTYMDKYAAPYRHYRRREAAASSSIPASASNCHNISELKAWRDAKIEQIASYVPLAYRASAEDGVERTFQSNRARIEREQAVLAQRLEDEEARKANQSGSAAPADKKAGKASPEGPAEPAADRAGKAVQQDASMGSTAAAGSANKTTNQGAADLAMAGPPPVATNSSAVQLAGEGSVELVRKTHMDGSAASIAAFAVLAALFVAYVGKGRRRQRVMEPEVYTNLIAEP